MHYRPMGKMVLLFFPLNCTGTNSISLYLIERVIDVLNLPMQARKFGVRAAMPGFIGCKLCPGLVFVPPNFERYTHYSELTREGLYNNIAKPSRTKFSDI